MPYKTPTLQELKRVYSTIQYHLRHHEKGVTLSKIMSFTGYPRDTVKKILLTLEFVNAIKKEVVDEITHYKAKEKFENKK